MNLHPGKTGWANHYTTIYYNYLMIHYHKDNLMAFKSTGSNSSPKNSLNTHTSEFSFISAVEESKLLRLTIKHRLVQVGHPECDRLCTCFNFPHLRCVSLPLPHPDTYQHCKIQEQRVVCMRRQAHLREELPQKSKGSDHPLVDPKSSLSSGI